MEKRRGERGVTMQSDNVQLVNAIDFESDRAAKKLKGKIERQGRRTDVCKRN